MHEFQVRLVHLDSKSNRISDQNYISGVKIMHLLLGYSVEHINDFLLNLGIKGIARLHPYCVRQGRAIIADILLKFSTVLNLSIQTDCVFGACFFLPSFYLLESQTWYQLPNKIWSTKNVCYIKTYKYFQIVLLFPFDGLKQFSLEKAYYKPL